MYSVQQSIYARSERDVSYRIVTTYYGKNRERGLTVTCRECGAKFDSLKQEYNTSLCPACNDRRRRTG